MDTGTDERQHLRTTLTKAAIQGLAPRTFYEELAQENSLHDFLQTYLSQSFTHDVRFREEMMRVLMDHSPGVVPELETELLQDLCESLSYFLEYTKPWRTPNQ